MPRPCHGRRDAEHHNAPVGDTRRYTIRLQDVHAGDAPRALTSPASLHRHLARSALLVAVLGLLPFLLDAHAAWRVLGTLVSVALVGRGLQLVWRRAFSTDPRHLTVS
jgi:hypothetical protein